MRLEYVPLPPPQDMEAYPVYINNEHSVSLGSLVVLARYMRQVCS